MQRIEDKLFKKAEILGSSFAEFLQLNNYNKTVVVSKALELNSNQIFVGLIKGLLGKGVDVINIGACTTSALCFALNTLKDIAFGIRATNANLNKNFNGFEILTKKGKIKEEELQEIFAISEAFPALNKKEKRGYLSNLDGNSLYSQGIIAFGKKIIENKKIANLKIVFDLRKVTCGLLIKNIMQEMLEETAGKYLLATSVNGISGATTVAGLPELQKEILREKADFGITYDEEGNKLIVLDRMGEIFQKNTLLLFAAKEILKENSGAGIIGYAEHRTNYSKTIEEFGGKALVIPEEDVYVEVAIKNNNAIFGEGQEGHFFFADKYYGYLDAIYATLRFLKIFSDLKKTKQAG